MRKSDIKRKTKETDIDVSVNLDGKGISEIETGVGFLDHMLTLFASHARMDLKVCCNGDIFIDDHHSVEDIGIALGLAIKNAIGDKKGICRYGSQILPMDESLVMCAIDLSGRAYLGFELPIRSKKIGSFDTELIEEFFAAFVRSCPMSLHIRLMTGRNSHHIAEGAFKSFGRSLRQAVSVDPQYSDEIPSTKGVL